MATIANLATMLSANAEGMDGGLKDAANRIRSFAASAASGAAAAAAAAFSQVAHAAQDFLGDALKRMDSILDTAKGAQRLNVSVQEMAAIEKFAGDRSQEFAHGLQHLNRMLGEVAQGSEETRRKFDEFGLDVDKFAQLSGFERTRTLLDFYKNLTDETTKAAFAFDFLGKSAAETGDLLDKGSKGLDEANARLERTYGSVYSGASVEQLRELKKDMKEMQELKEGITSQIEIGGLLGLKEGGEQFARLMGAGPLLDRFRAAKSEAGPSTDVSKTPENPFLGTTRVEERVSLGDALGEMHEYLAGLEKLYGQIGGTPLERYHAMLKTVADDHKLGATNAGLQAIAENQLLGKLHEEMFHFSEQAKQKAKSPLERFLDETAMLNFAMKEGAISAELYERSLLGVVDAVDRGSASPKFAAAMDLNAPGGAKQAYSTILNAQYGNREETAQDRVDRVRQAMLDEQKRTTTAAKETAAAVKQLVPVQPAGLFGALGGS